ncbi:hypothetical protein PMIN07_009062 [Paraphaeosphaeria minitans]
MRIRATTTTLSTRPRTRCEKQKPETADSARFGCCGSVDSRFAPLKPSLTAPTLRHLGCLSAINSCLPDPIR